jgi:hypothetical protein
MGLQKAAGVDCGLRKEIWDFTEHEDRDCDDERLIGNPRVRFRSLLM